MICCKVVKGLYVHRPSWLMDQAFWSSHFGLVCIRQQHFLVTCNYANQISFMYSWSFSVNVRKYISIPLSFNGLCSESWQTDGSTNPEQRYWQCLQAYEVSQFSFDFTISQNYIWNRDSRNNLGSWNYFWVLINVIISKK